MFTGLVEAIVDRIVLKPEIRSRLADSVETALKLSQGLVIIAIGQSDAQGGWTDQVYSEKFACPVHPNVSLPELEPRLFSFNSPHGACPDCHGLGTTFEFDPELMAAVISAMFTVFGVAYNTCCRDDRIDAATVEEFNPPAAEFLRAEAIELGRASARQLRAWPLVKHRTRFVQQLATEPGRPTTVTIAASAAMPSGRRVACRLSAARMSSPRNAATVPEDVSRRVATRSTHPSRLG